MNLESFIDTVLNVTVFAFIGLLVWLYIKPTAGEDPTKKD